MRFDASGSTGSILIENRRGRTSHEYPPLLFAGQRGFDEWGGEVWGAHVAWSGNHTMFAERLPDGRRYLQGGELLHPGEVVLEPGAVVHDAARSSRVHSTAG